MDELDQIISICHNISNEDQCETIFNAMKDCIVAFDEKVDCDYSVLTIDHIIAVSTRSSTKGERRKKRKIQFVHPNVHDLMVKTELREKFLDHLFDKYNIDSILDFSRWPIYQKSDFNLNLVRKYIVCI